MMTRSQLAFIVASGFVLVAFAKVSTVGRNVTVTGPDAVAVNGPEIQIDVQNGATATVTPPAADSVLVHLQDRLVVDAVSAESWKDKVGLWLDASKPETINYYCSASGNPVTFCGNKTIEPKIGSWNCLMAV
ncbi:MAG: hypothetical protein Q4G65_14610 [bacterium]|nr:hypothetical protein [bacterium]